ncbi:copper resistance CopC/CopD family protein [Gordonia rubripertincta]|uniref:copper resistance CopC/CopD family protein n=1 Tax=Gordonia rubripertincta TaxID=36822 RepID=UPI0013C35543|nr:copper resistance protein CopC [Gordonia rubripertincta]
MSAFMSGRRVGALIGFLALAASVSVSTWGAGAASAHAIVVATVPADGAHVDEAPGTLIVDLDESVTLVAGSAGLVDADGRRHEIGARLDGGQRRVVLLPAESLSDGAYLATARVMSSDTHVVSLAIRFTVGAVTEPVPELAQVPGGGNGPWNEIVKALVYLGLVSTAGIVFAVRFVWQEVLSDKRFRYLYRVGAVILVVGLVGRLLTLTAGRVDGMTNLTAAALADVVMTRSGVAMLVAGVLTAAVAIRGPVRSAEDRPGQASALIAGVAALMAVTLCGHGGSASRWPYAFATTFVHVYAMALWLGGIAVLALVLRRPENLSRWHRVVAGHVAALLLTGGVLAALQVRYPSALLSTGYGIALLLKISAVAGALVAGYLLFRWFGHRRGPAGPVDTPHPASGAGTSTLLLERPTLVQVKPVARQRFMRILVVEIVLVLAAVVATSVLSSTPPASETYDTGTSARLDFGAGQVLEVGTDSVRRGPVTLAVRPVGSGESDAAVLDVELASIDANVARLPVEMERLGAGSGIGWESRQLVIPTAGEWKVTVRFDAGDGPKLASFLYEVI